jgi:hypothetical protein
VTPARKAAQPGSEVGSAKDTERWLAGLPMANIGETSRQVFKRLVEFNRTDMPFADRRRIVESFREPVDYLTKNLQRHYLFLGMPLSPKSRKIAALARELNAELGLSYKVLAEDILKDEDHRHDRKYLLPALFQALDCLGRVLVQTALVYSPQPTGLWREMHSIYAYASQSGLQDTPIRDEHGAQVRETCLEDLYKTWLLFAVSSPNRLRQSQIQQLAVQVHLWAPRVRFVGHLERGVRLAQFAVDLWSDAPPVHKSLLKLRDSKRMKTFDLRGLLQFAKSEFEQAAQDETDRPESPELSRSLLRRLILSWSKTREREFARTRLNFELTVKVGLTALHQHLGETQAQNVQPAPVPRLAAEWHNPDDRAGPDSELDSLSLSPIEDNLKTGEHFVRRPKEETKRGTRPRAATEWVDNAEKQLGEDYLVSTNNESAGGYCVQWPASKNSKVRIGEVMGIQTGADRNQLSIGVIRWMEQLPGQDLSLGVHIVAQRCALGLLRGREGKNREKEYRCVLLPEDEAGDRYSGLLLQPAEVPSSSGLELHTNDGSEPIRLTRVVESTGSFTHVQFTYLKDEVTNQPDRKEDDDNFEDLWGNL